MAIVVKNLCFTSFLLLNVIPGRSLPFPTAQSHASSKARQLTSRINCSDCKQHITNRIRQLQHLHRMKQRIMSAIRDNGNEVPVADTSQPLPATDSEMSGKPTTVLPTVTPTIKTTEQVAEQVTQQVAKQVTEQVADSHSLHQDKPAPNTKERKDQKPVDDQQGESGEGKAANMSRTSTEPVPVVPDVPGVARKKGVGGRKEHVPSAKGGRKGSRKKHKDDNPESSVMETSGPKIVSFSRVVSSGKRKHVLQFTLKRAAQGEELEVVKAHLWLLLTRHRSHGHWRRANNITSSDSTVGKTRKGSYSVDDDDDIGGGDGGQARHRRRKGKKRKGAKRGKRDALPRYLSLSTDNNDTTSTPVAGSTDTPFHLPQSSNRGINGQNHSHDVKQLDGVNNNSDDDDRIKEEEEEEEEDDKFKAVLRVLMVADNGTRTLMTYLRTNVKVTHWQKVRLPASVIQQQLQSSKNTLTLMIRCRRCGGAVRMVLPREARLKARKLRRKERRRKRKERGKDKGKRKNRNRRHGVMRLDRRAKTRVRRLKRKFRPLPFLVINTRLRFKQTP